MTKIEESSPPKFAAAAVSSEPEETDSITVAAIAGNGNGSDSEKNQTDDASSNASAATETTTLIGETNVQAENSDVVTVLSSTTVSGENQVGDTNINAALEAAIANDGAESGTSIVTTEEETNPSPEDDLPPQNKVTRYPVPAIAARGGEGGEQSSIRPEFVAGDELFCGVCTTDHQGDHLEEEEEEDDNDGVTVHNEAVGPFSLFPLPGAYRVYLANSNTNAQQSPPLQRSSIVEAESDTLDIESELSRLGIPFVEAELVNPHEDSDVLTAESRHSLPVNDQTNGNVVESSEETDNVYQARHIPTVTICGKEMTRSTATLLACVVVLVAVVSVIVPVAITQTNKSATQKITERQSRIVDDITSFAKGDISNPDTPHGQALKWMLGPKNARMYSGMEGGLNLMKQRFTMAVFYYATGGESWLNKGNFLSEDHVCEWSNIIVCNKGGNTTELRELQMGNNNLQGKLPQELLYLDTLTSLNLTGNAGLVGSLPSEIGGMASLEVLDLHETNFVGPLPDMFVNLRRLTHLDLHNNNLEGANVTDIITRIKQLRYLDLAKNLFTESSPNPLFRLTNMEYLDISENDFGNSGDFGYKFGYLMPSTIGTLTNLRVLNLANNKLGGPISSNLKNCKRLEELYLTDNDFNDGIPSELGQLRELKVLDLSNNGKLGGIIPSVLGELFKLEHLNLKNTGLTGPIPEELGRLTNLDALNLDLNSLTGSIPRDIFNMEKMKELRLASNSLEGTIPAEVGNATGLTQLTLFENKLEGPLPREIGNLVNLTSLVLGSNGLNSTLPETLGNLVNLERFVFEQNSFTGELPTTLGNLKKLKEIHAGNNGLSGPLPTELGRLTVLEEIGFTENEFNGTIPTELGNLSNLWFLWLGVNSFSGTVPGWIGTSKLAQSLQELEITYSNLEGTLPAEWGMLSELKKLKMHRNTLITGTIPFVWANMTKLEGLWMFNTSLTGSVSHLCREDFEDFGSQDCEDCGLEVDLEDVECECCACCVNNDYLETDDDEYDDDGNENEDLDEGDISTGST